LAIGEGDGAPTPLNRSLQYMRAMVILVVFAVVTQLRGRVMRYCALAAGMFAVSLGFCTVDLAICAAHPSGSHFM
jgi:hypothetical protein